MTARAATAVLLLWAALAPGATHAQAQAVPDQPHVQLMSELGRLREAATLESAGNLAAAERIVVDVLAANPTSLSALLTMERLLVAQGRLPEIMPAVEHLLELDPASVIGHQLRLRVLASLDDAKRLEKAIAQWIRTTPTIETPYRESAIVWRQRREHARAIAVLEQGRRRIDRPDALALELGDAYAAAGEIPRAAVEWSRAVGPLGRGFLLVQRRVQGLPDGGARVIPLLVEQLADRPHSFGRQRAATLLAIEAGLEPAALRHLNVLAELTPPEELEGVLVELARRADGAGLHRVALWAYTELLKPARDAGSTLAIRSRIAELALLAGDTALAASTYRDLEAAAAAGSPQRAQAVALRIQLTAREGDVAQALAEYESFREEYGHGAELDATAAAVAEALLARADHAAAERVLTGVKGPRSALLRSRIHLQRGDAARAREELLGAAPLLRGGEATETIALAALLSRLSARGGDIVAQVIAAPAADRWEHIETAHEQARGLPASDRAAILDFLATAADALGHPEDAAGYRREIVDTLPRTQEAPAALLALARAELVRGEGTDAARVLLEKLIMEYPRSALAPQARAELQRLQTRASAR